MANNNHFNLTLDTIAPEGSITRPAQYLKEDANLTIVTGGASYMYVWYDTSAITSEIPEGLEPVAANTYFRTEFATNTAEDGIYFYHLVLMDDLNNKSDVYTTEAITYDITSPVIIANSLKINNGAVITSTREVNIVFGMEDATSGPATYTISGDLAETYSGTFTAEEITAKKFTKDIVLSGSGDEDVSKTVTVQIVDNSGNKSESKSTSIVLDTTKLAGNIILKNTAGTSINNLWVNTAPFKLTIELNAEDCVAYKVYGDFVGGGSTEPTDWTIIEATGLISLDKSFTPGDDDKIIYAKVKDDAGNETTLTAVSAHVDYSAPTVSIELASTVTNVVSEIEGYNTITITPTVDAAIAGAKSYVLLVDDTETTIKDESTTGDVLTIPASFTYLAADLSGEGEHTFKFKVTDRAGNTTTSEAKTISKDVTAPEGNITTPATWAGNQANSGKFDVTATATDTGAGLDSMVCWVSTVAEDTTIPVTATKQEYSVNPTSTQIDWTNSTESANNYVHIKYTDKVGNTSIAHSGSFGIDTVPPTVGSIAFEKSVYSSATATVSITYSDATSGVKEMCLTGDFVGGDTETWETKTTTKTITLTEPDGIKTITIKFKDYAGNINEAPYAQVSCELDTTGPGLEVQLWEADESDTKQGISSVGSFSVRVICQDDEGKEASPDNLEYIIYGDFNTTPDADAGISIEECTYKPVVFEEGKDYMLLTGYYATKDKSTGEGQTKEVYVIVRDNAGNETKEKAVFTYCQAIPEIDITQQPDYNNISIIDKPRRTSSGPIEGTSADTINFAFTPAVTIQEFQICAYDTQAAAEAGTHEIGQIGDTYGSIHMHSAGLSTKEEQYCTIKGKDLQTTCPTDGLKIIVIYIKNPAGTWSKAAKFTTD